MMYLTVKQQVKHLSKENYKSLKELCHIAKNLTNQAIYNVRQHYFNEGTYLSYQNNYNLLKTSKIITKAKKKNRGNRVEYRIKLSLHNFEYNQFSSE